MVGSPQEKVILAHAPEETQKARTTEVHAMKPAKPRKVKPANSSELCKEELEQLISSRNFTTRFRPVVSLKSCQVFGHLARVYGPPDSSMRDMAQYFAIARELDQLEKLSRSYFEAVVAHFANSDVTGRLLLPLPQACLDGSGHDVAHPLAKALKKHELSAHRITLIVPGRSPAQRLGASVGKGMIKELRRLGVELAAEGIGCIQDEAAFLADWKPGLRVLHERHFEDVDVKTASLGHLRALIQGEIEQGGQVLAQGINSLSQFHLIRELGIEAAAGDFFGKFHSRPYDLLSAAAFQAIDKGRGSDASVPRDCSRLLERLLIKRPPVSPETPSEEVFQIFETEFELRAIAVVKEDLPVGLISRYELIDTMARPFRHELFGRRPCDRFMDPDPLIMDVGISLPQLTEMVIRADPRHLVSGFVVTERGRYLGMGSVQDLMREISAMQMEAAKYANPLTQLPGNVPINQKIDKLLAERAVFAVAYCDLDHFKPFNDAYGYAKGDQIIQLTARILSDAIEPESDFIGHIGGDDFVLIFRGGDWKARCEQALQRFEEEILAFFSPGDIARGGYVTTNRKGEMESFALTSLSIGAAEIDCGAYANHLAVATVAVEVKKMAKAIAGNSLYIDRRGRGPRGEA